VRRQDGYTVRFQDYPTSQQQRTSEDVRPSTSAGYVYQDGKYIPEAPPRSRHGSSRGSEKKPSSSSKEGRLPSSGGGAKWKLQSEFPTDKEERERRKKEKEQKVKKKKSRRRCTFM